MSINPSGHVIRIRDLSKEQIIFFENLLKDFPTWFEVNIEIINSFYDVSKNKWVFNMEWILRRLEQMWIIENLDVKHLWSIDSYVYWKLHDKFSYSIKDLSLIQDLLNYFFDTTTNQEFVKETQKLAKSIDSELVLEERTGVNISKIKPFLSQLNISYQDEELLEFNLALLSYRYEYNKDIISRFIKKISGENYGVFLARFNLFWYLEKYCHCDRKDLLPLFQSIKAFYTSWAIKFNTFGVVWKNNFILFSELPKQWKYTIKDWLKDINLHNPRTAICLLYYYSNQNIDDLSELNRYDQSNKDIVVNQFKSKVWWTTRTTYKQQSNQDKDKIRYYNQVKKLIKYLS